MYFPHFFYCLQAVTLLAYNSDTDHVAQFIELYMYLVPSIILIIESKLMVALCLLNNKLYMITYVA
jgi:hypothetical protein